MPPPIAAPPPPAYNAGTHEDPPARPARHHAPGGRLADGVHRDIAAFEAARRDRAATMRFAPAVQPLLGDAARERALDVRVKGGLLLG